MGSNFGKIFHRTYLFRVKPECIATERTWSSIFVYDPLHQPSELLFVYNSLSCKKRRIQIQSLECYTLLVLSLTQSNRITSTKWVRAPAGRRQIRRLESPWVGHFGQFVYACMLATGWRMGGIHDTIDLTLNWRHLSSILSTPLKCCFHNIDLWKSEIWATNLQRIDISRGMILHQQ